MFNKIIQFIKYNNLTVLILLAVFIFSSAVFAQTEAGQEMIGSEKTEIQGIDKTLLLEADLENFDMDYKIEKIEEDDPSAGSGQGYYYVTYTFIDLALENSAWQYQIQEKTKKVSKKLKADLGLFLTEELAEEYGAKIKDLKAAQKRAMEEGAEERMKVEKYGGLIGKTLDLAEKVFPGYESVKINKIPSPEIPDFIKSQQGTGEEIIDNIEEIYSDYIKVNDPDIDNIFGSLDNCPENYNSDQLDSDGDGIGDACDFGPEEADGTAASDEAIGEVPASEGELLEEEMINEEYNGNSEEDFLRESKEEGAEDIVDEPIAEELEIQEAEIIEIAPE